LSRLFGLSRLPGWFRLSGWFRLPGLFAPEVFDEAGDDHCGLIGLFVNLIKLCLINIALVETNIEM
jgi:hypothetical protein